MGSGSSRQCVAVAQQRATLHWRLQAVASNCGWSRRSGGPTLIFHVPFLGGLPVSWGGAGALGWEALTGPGGRRCSAVVHTKPS